MYLLRRTLVVIFILLLLLDLLWWMLAIGSGHTIPSSTIRFFLTNPIVLIILIFLTHKYLRKKDVE